MVFNSQTQLLLLYLMYYPGNMFRLAIESSSGPYILSLSSALTTTPPRASYYLHIVSYGSNMSYMENETIYTVSSYTF